MRFYIVLMATLFLTGCHNPKVPTKKDLKGIAQEIMINAKNCSLITIDSLGIAHARVMDPFLPEENFTVWMATNPKSLKVRQIKKVSVMLPYKGLLEL